MALFIDPDPVNWGPEHWCALSADLADALDRLLMNDPGAKGHAHDMVIRTRRAIAQYDGVGHG